MHAVSDADTPESTPCPVRTLLLTVACSAAQTQMKDMTSENIGSRCRAVRLFIAAVLGVERAFNSK
jgi:hypothetical protein